MQYIPYETCSAVQRHKIASNSCTAKLQASVVQTLDSAIQRINHYPADSLISFPNTYPLGSDLSSG